MTDEPSKLSEFEQRLEVLEREFARLRKRVGDLVGSDKPDFDPLEFQRALSFYLMLLILPALLLFGLAMPLGLYLRLPHIEVFPGIPLFDIAGMNTRHPGIGIGVISTGGLAIGALALGGGAIGIIAMGGGAFGLIATGGGAVGFLAVGGGAMGYIAIGGGAAGYYVLAGDGRGKFVFSRRRQDPEAVELFTRYFPRLKRALTGPMPVVPVGREKEWTDGPTPQI